MEEIIVLVTLVDGTLLYSTRRTNDGKSSARLRQTKIYHLFSSTLAFFQTSMPFLLFFFIICFIHFF
ncbi:hypothetical protein GIB67_021722, partial [Kingdonia uniflora]